MKAKLIKLVVGVGYRLDDENGNLIAATLQGSKTKLSIKNCEAIERGYDLEELAINYANEELSKEFTSKACNFYGFSSSYIEGFKKALELLSDKKFSELDLDKAFNLGKYVEREDCTENYLAYKQSILQKTEWDVEIIEECLDKDCDGVNRKGDCISTGKPKLDAEGCLILK
jgi:hypothetical protein